jgi:hypothetical protein
MSAHDAQNAALLRLLDRSVTHRERTWDAALETDGKGNDLQ